MAHMKTTVPWEEITLSASEMAFAAFSGVAREAANRADGRGRAGGFSKSGWDTHIEGACGECAAGKCLGVYWPPGMGTMKGPDLLHCIEVRTTPGHNYRLPVKRTDPEDRWFVLVTGTAPVFFVRGWIGQTISESISPTCCIRFVRIISSSVFSALCIVI